MNDSLRIVGKRALTVAVAAATILWTVGAQAFMPFAANAASAGDLVRGTLSTVYYVASDGQRYAFPTQKNYFTWYSDFSGVEWVSDAELAAIPLAGNVMRRPGSAWIKIMSDAKTYAVTPQGQLRWIEDEATAVALAGSDWNQFIEDEPDVFFADYTVGTSIMDAGDAYNGALVEMSGTTWLVWDGEKREVTSAGFTANRFQDRFVLDGTGIDLAGLTTGSDVTGYESGLSDTAQLGDEVTGGLSVSIASDTPAQATVPAGAASVPFAKFKFTASSGSATINQLVFKLGGVGAVGNIDEVYLYEGNTRLTDGRSVNSSTREVTFSGLNLSLSSGETMYLTVRADISTTPTGGDTASFSLQSAGSVVGTATVSGSFPVSGNTMTFSETDAGEVIIDKTGSISDPVIGEEGAVIAKFSVDADGEDASIEQVTVNVDDSADHTNYQLWNGDDMLATGTVNGDLVTFVLTNPLEVEDGDSENLEVSADIGGDAGDAIAVAIEEEADVLATGGDFGFNLAVDITGYDATSCASSAEDCSYSETEGGELTFAFNGPSSDDIQIDADDQVLMEFTITAENWTEIKEFDVILTCENTNCDEDDDDGGLEYGTDDEPNLTNVTIREADGSAWMGPEEYAAADASDDAVTLTFTEDQILNAGESIDLMITVDVASTAVDGDSFSATLDMSTVDAEDVNGDTLASTEIVPTADIVGHPQTVTDSSLDVEASTPPSDGTFVKGTSSVSVVGFTFEAGNTSDVTVTDVTYSISADSDATFTPDDDVNIADHISSCSMYDNETGALVDGPESPEDVDGVADGDAELLFESFDWTVDAGETRKALLKCNFSNTDRDSTDAANDTYAFWISAAADVVAEDEDGEDVTVGAIAETNGDGSEAVITIADSGSITAVLDGNSPNSTIILGSSTGVSMSAYRFDATDEDFIVEELTLVNCVGFGADGDTTDCTGAGESVGADDAAAAVKISYEDSEGTTVTKTGFLSGGTVTFDNLDFLVPAATVETLSVMIDTSGVSSTGAASGSQIELAIADAAVTGFTATPTFEAVGDASGETVTNFGANIGANEMTLRKTKPTISLASGSPSGEKTAGNIEALRVNVSADSRGFVTLDGITFEVASSDADGDWGDCDAGQLGDEDSWEFYDLSDPSEKLDDDAGDWAFYDSGEDDCDAGNPVTIAALNLDGVATHPSEEIGAGSTVTYVVKVDSTGADEDDSIRLDIPDESATDAYVNPMDAIRWEDDTESDAVATVCDDFEGTDDGDCVDGDLVRELPLTGGDITF